MLDLADRHARHRQNVLLVAVGAYIGVSLMANVMSVRIVLLGPWAIDAGTFTYPLTFTLRDVVHKAGGRTAARVTIVTGAALNLVMVAAFWVTANLPADQTVGPQTEFGNWSDATRFITTLPTAIMPSRLERCDSKNIARSMHSSSEWRPTPQPASRAVTPAPVPKLLCPVATSQPA